MAELNEAESTKDAKKTKKEKKMEEKAGAEYAQAMLQLFGCSAATQELPSMAFVSNTSIFNQFFYFLYFSFSNISC